MTNLAAFLTESARQHPDRDAVVLGDTRLTYAQVDTFANMCANLLTSRGIGPGDTVALSAPNLPYFPIVYYGILKAGATVVPLNILLSEREVAYHLADSGAKAYFCFEGIPGLPIGENGLGGFNATESCEHLFVITADLAAPSPFEGTETMAQAMGSQSGEFTDVEVGDSDTAVILYTSGTTGQPKGAELTHDNMRSNALACQEIFGTTEEVDRFLCTLPMFHAFGQTVNLNFGFSIGATLVLVPRFEPEPALQLLGREKITFFSGVPTMYWGLLGALEGTEVDVAQVAARLRAAVSGGAALPKEVHKDFEAKFGVTIMEGYGLSETSPVASFSVMGEPARVGSIGVPIPGVEMKLVNEDWSEVPDGDPEALGEIAIKGPNIMKGYLGRPDATAEAIRDGWFRSGDLARKDADGWYYIVDRSKDMIIRGGFNVYPRELEEVLMTHPDVSLAAVIGVPDDSHGEEVKAFVILTPGATATAEDLIAWGKEQFAKYKYPRLLEIVPQLPMTATGKILKRELS